MSLKVQQSKTELSEPHYKAPWKGKDSGIWDEKAPAKKKDILCRLENQAEVLCMPELAQQTWVAQMLCIAKGACFPPWPFALSCGLSS